MTDSVSNEGNKEAEANTNIEKNDLAHVPKKDYDDLDSKFKRIDSVNQALIAESEGYKAKLSEAQERLNALEKSQKDSKVKGAKNPDEFNALLQEELKTVNEQYQGKLDSATKELEAAKAQINEFQIVSKLQKAVTGKVKADMFDYIKADAMRELRLDPSNPEELLVVDAEGKTVLSKLNPGMPMRHAEWIDSKKKITPSMFEPEGINKGTLDGTKTNSNNANNSGKKYTRAEWAVERMKITDRTERVKADKEQGF